VWYPGGCSAQVIDALDPGSVSLVIRLDRLARSTRDLRNLLATVADRERGSDHSLTPGQIRERLMAS